MQSKQKKLIAAAVCAVVLIALVIGCAVYLKSETTASDITVEEAEQIVKDTLASAVGTSPSQTLTYIYENSSVAVKGIEYGTSKNVILSCTYTTVDAAAAVESHSDSLINMDTVNSVTGMQMTSVALKGAIDEMILEDVKGSEVLSGEVEIELYEMDDGFVMYTTDEVMDTLLGGVATAKNLLPSTYVGEDGTQKKVGANITNGLYECLKVTYDKTQPDNSAPLVRTWNKFVSDCKRNFVDNNNWKYITRGLWTTLKLTFFAVILGVLLGFIVAIIRCTKIKTGRLTIPDAICRLYLTVIRGTPVLVQLMIIYFVILMPVGVDKFITAVICFGLNSGAYVAEIIRGGIMSIDDGQMEAGRSLGFNYSQTMIHIILPQAFKTVLPALANEFIVLLKETSVSAYIGLNDLARGGDIIRGITYTPFLPLLAVALIYLVIVMILTKLVSLLERRLNANAR
jgi:polar amino acid transport system permease protein/polar amino acid transport system substrate-binding protein